MKRIITFTLLTFMTLSAAKADEGMWLLNLLKKMRMAEMKDMGLDLSAKDIYAVNKSSMKDGLLMLNGGSCTAELVSDKGLAMTNHHCAFEAIRSQSDTGSKNYLEHGFWAQEHSEELPIEDMKASILVRIEDVSERLDEALSDTMTQKERGSKKKGVIEEIEKNAFDSTKKHYRAEVKEFYSGDQYYLFVYKDFNDVRLVGGPPSDIGKFGGNEDNWEWPRHTGDFSLLRVYANENNKPAPYSEDNVPYQPDHHFPISLDGVDKGDFTFIMGFPGRTQRYLSSYGIQQALELEYPARIKIRDKRLSLMRKAMDNSERIDIAYASRYAKVSNYYKYFKGQSKRLKDLEVKKQKKQLEDRFREWVKADEERKEYYGNVLPDLKSSYEEERPTILPRVYLSEAAFGSDAVAFAREFFGLLQAMGGGDSTAIAEQTESLRETAKEHFRNYDAPTDKRITNALYKMYYADLDSANLPPLLSEYANEDDELVAYGDTMFANAFLDEEDKVMEFLDDPNIMKLRNDMIFKTALSVLQSFGRKFRQKSLSVRNKRKKAKRRFIQGLKKMKPKKDFYPNANSTPRLTYGAVSGYDHPTDGLLYDHHTTLEGAIAKDDTTKRHFDVPEKLESLHEKKDYGRYADDSTGQLPLCFVHNTDITGGNSGSPVFNDQGHLIGCAFDGNWEAMSGDIAYEPRLQRTISVDARYILFVIDKFANADHLIEEMTIVENEG